MSLSYLFLEYTFVTENPVSLCRNMEHMSICQKVIAVKNTLMRNLLLMR